MRKNAKTGTIMDLKAMSSLIRRKMDEKGLSTKELSMMLGVSFQAVRKYVRGVGRPNLNHLFALSRIFGITIDELMIVDKKKAEKRYTKALFKENRA